MLLQMLQWRRQNTGEIVSYAEAINSQVVKWAVLTHIDSLIQSTPFWSEKGCKQSIVWCPFPFCGIFLLVCLKEIKP